MKQFNKYLAIILSLSFLGVGFLTINDYGISWDEPIHFYRGQAYLHLFLTGKTNYQDLSKTNRRSFYQSDRFSADYFLAHDSGHPPLNGELAALSNYIFYQKLGWVSDVNSYQIFNLIVSALLVFIVCQFALEYFGVLPAWVTAFSVIMYPLFFAESHFNIKDPPEVAFFAATIWCFLKSLTSKSKSHWLILSGIFFGLALGTKFNVFFIVFILGPFLLARFKKELWFKKSVDFAKILPYFLTLIISGLIAFLIFWGSWPFLWHNFLPNFHSIVGYYQDIGLNLRYQPDSFFILGFNTFPIQWILFTTPPLILFLAFLGVIYSVLHWRSKDGLGILLLFWLFLPILRVTLPNTVIYGGDRQIMEFLPAMAILSGVGAQQAVNLFSKLTINKRAISLAVLILFILPLITLIKLHPYQNTYFNFFIGGLKGAQEKNFPSWGNTLGSAYRQGANWLNHNLEPNARLALVQDSQVNLPLEYLRPDINYDNKNFSGLNRQGEYLMELTFNDTGRDFYYDWEYVDKFLKPVDEIKVDGVALLKIWKNDLVHTQSEWQVQSLPYESPLTMVSTKSGYVIDLGKNVLLSEVKISLQNTGQCQNIVPIFVETSLEGVKWTREKDPVPTLQLYKQSNFLNNQIDYQFAGRDARFIQFLSEKGVDCLASNYGVAIKVLK